VHLKSTDIQGLKSLLVNFKISQLSVSNQKSNCTFLFQKIRLFCRFRYFTCLCSWLECLLNKSIDCLCVCTRPNTQIEGWAMEMEPRLNLSGSSTRAHCTLSQATRFAARPEGIFIPETPIFHASCFARAIFVTLCTPFNKKQSDSLLLRIFQEPVILSETPATKPVAQQHLALKEMFLVFCGYLGVVYFLQFKRGRWLLEQIPSLHNKVCFGPYNCASFNILN
jgi:hypothetical protein